MTHHFFITGHQRSRTAWCANLFTDGLAFCWHDATRMMRRPPHLEDVVNGEMFGGYKEVGDSDNGLPIFPGALDWYYDEQPDLPVCIIRRDPKDVLKSLKRMYGGKLSNKALERSISVSEEGLEYIVMTSENLLEVDFYDLNDLEVIDEMARHLLDRPINMERASFLRMMNVQMQEPYYSMKFTDAVQAHISAIVGE